MYKQLIQSVEETIVTGIAILSIAYMVEVGLTGNEIIDIAAIAGISGLGGYNLYKYKNGNNE